MRYLVKIDDSFLKTSQQEIIFISDKKDSITAFNHYVEQYSCGDDQYKFIEFDEKHLKIVYNIIYGEEDESITEENQLELYPLKSIKEL